MIAKHTPGPWRLNRRFCFNVEDENGRTVARVNSEPKTYDEALANARLIAAAPDLLAAAEKALSVLSIFLYAACQCLPCETCPKCDVEKQLKTAIAKAKGVEQQ